MARIVVLGASEDLAFIEKLINQIDVPTQQILIEAFVVEVGSDFDKAFGTRIGQATSNFTAIDITVTGGNLSSFTAVSTTVYTATFTPTDDGATTVDVGAKNFVEKSIPETKGLINEQLVKLRAVKKELEDELNNLNSEITATMTAHEASQK